MTNQVTVQAKGESSQRSRSFDTFVSIFYLIVFAILLGCSLPAYSLTNRILACALFAISTWPLIQYIKRGIGVPLIELPLASFAAYYCIPLLVEDVHPVYRAVLKPIPHLVDQVLISSILFVFSLLLGFTVCSKWIEGRKSPLINLAVSTHAFIVIAITLIGINLAMSVLGISSDNKWNRAVQILFSQDLGVAILSLMYYQGKLSKAEGNVAIALLVVMTTFGLLTGMTQHAAQPVFVWVLCRWIVMKHFPVVAVLLGISFILIFQPIKHEYRKRFWFSETRNVSRIDKLLSYGEIAGDVWFSRSNSHSESVSDKVKFAITQRFSMMLFTQRYLELTPKQIPYKNGESIIYIFYGWIPRAVWPDKPAATIANKRYPIEYGIQHPKTTGASFGVGHVAEIHVNFGILGYFPVCFLLGCMASIPKYMFGHSPKDVGAVSVQVVSAVNLMFIGSTIGLAYGGLLTQLIAQGLILYAGGVFLGGKQPDA